MFWVATFQYVLQSLVGSSQKVKLVESSPLSYGHAWCDHIQRVRARLTIRQCRMVSMQYQRERTPFYVRVSTKSCLLDAVGSTRSVRRLTVD